MSKHPTSKNELARRAALHLVLLFTAALLLAGGCSDEGGESRGDADAMDADMVEPVVLPTPPPTAPEVTPEPFTEGEWLRAVMTQSDAVYPQLERRTFAFPGEGVDGDGVTWTALTLGEGGEIGALPAGSIGYVVARFETPAPTRLIVRADTVADVYFNGAAQPGDIYGSRRRRIPLVTRAGENLLVIRAVGGRSEPEVELWSTTDELTFNLEDVTRPDLLVGDEATQYIGAPILNLTGEPAMDVVARVLESEHFHERGLLYPALAPGAASAVAFELAPKAAFTEAEQTIEVRLRIESQSTDWSYERTVELTTVGPDVAYRRTFRSAIDDSAQYYGVRPPTSVDPEKDYALILSLHGASVEGIGQARAYSGKDWAYVVAPTNRRPFGFDWEEWGRLDGLEVFEEAKKTFSIDPTQLYLTGHSMGGHGTWQFGTLFPGSFAVVAPSAGWATFETYTGDTLPANDSPFGRARASSKTLNYISNLARRGVYIIHGSADDNVPVREGRDMAALLAEITDDLIYHEEPGVGHWWDGDASEGADCVDWPPLMDFMQAHRLDPHELDFDFRTPSPWVSPRHSYATVRSALDPYQDVTLSSRVEGARVSLTAENVRAATFDGAALAAKGIEVLSINGVDLEVSEEPIEIGPEDGKRPGQQGPFNEVYHRPFCFVYPDTGPDAYRDYASYLVTDWAITGNGHACAVPLSELSPELREARNTIYLGLSPDEIEGEEGLSIAWDAQAISLGEFRFEEAALAFVFPEGDRLSAVITATEGEEYLLMRVRPFSSRGGLPDYLVWGPGGGIAAGFFSPEWTFDPSLGVP